MKDILEGNYDSVVWDQSKFIYPSKIEMTPFECDMWISKTMAIVSKTYNIKTQIKSAMTKPGNYSFPIITCENITKTQRVIYLKLGNETKIDFKNGCVIVEGTDETQLLRAFYALLLSSGIVSLLGILQHFFPGIMPNAFFSKYSGRVFSTVGNPLFLSSFLAMVIPFTLAFTTADRPPTLSFMRYGTALSLMDNTKPVIELQTVNISRMTTSSRAGPSRRRWRCSMAEQGSTGARSSTRARTFPTLVPVRKTSPILRVPFCTRTVATGPLPLEPPPIKPGWVPLLLSCCELFDWLIEQVPPF
jgi:hypothetical protein